MQQNTDYKDFHQNPNLKHFQWAVIRVSLHLTNYSLLRYRHTVKVFLMFFLIFFGCLIIYCQSGQIVLRFAEKWAFSRFLPV